MYLQLLARCLYDNIQINLNQLQDKTIREVGAQFNWLVIPHTNKTEVWENLHFSFGICLGCKRKVEFSEPSIYPILHDCRCCYKNSKIVVTKLSYEIEFEFMHSWKKEIQIQFLIWLITHIEHEAQNAKA